jgi:hypothetical protein
MPHLTPFTASAQPLCADRAEASGLTPAGLTYPTHHARGQDAERLGGVVAPFHETPNSAEAH